MFWEVNKENTDTLPPLDQVILADNVDLSKFEGGKAKADCLALSQRHFLALGDLCRYKALIDKTDILESKCWYIKAVQANFSNGRSFNQLAVLAVQSRNYLDLVFHYVQALATKYSFESSRESLELVFNDIRNMVLSNASDINLNGTKLQIEDATTKAFPEDSSDIGDGKSASNMNIKLQNQAIILLLHSLGILITNISMEEFAKVSEAS
uniref:DNA/RNA-binding domain-containing protein n=1 Tax=Ditylenchus dipsaci TaxID=166011 RepID=A0A915ER13_9BILA